MTPSRHRATARSASSRGRERDLRFSLRYRGWFLTLLAVVAAAASWWWIVERGREVGPVILVSIDTLRADRLPIYGYGHVDTPHLDAFAADAIVFERAYSHSPQTLPAHTSILTGKLPIDHGVRDNMGFTVPEGERLLPTMLRERGFTSAGFGSAFVLREASGIGRGFDVYDSEIVEVRAVSSMGGVQRDGMATLDLARSWLASVGPAPFFLFFHIYEPHRPYAPPERHARYEDRYDGEVAYADEIVGSLFQTLKDRGLYDHSSIVLLSDHGEGLGDHGEEEHGVFLYDESIRVPLLVKLLRQEAAGKRVPNPVQHVDLLPTILELVGAPIPSGLPGRSLLSAMVNDERTLEDRGIVAETLYPRYHFGWSELYALTDARYRFILAPKPELYDLERDPGERTNLVETHKGVAAAMRDALDAMIQGHQVVEPQLVSEEDRRRFQALGYIGVPSDPAVAATEDRVDPKDRVEVLQMYRAAATLQSEMRFADAADLFRRIVEQDPEMRDVWIQLARTLTRMGRTEKAVEAYERAIALDPGAPATLLAMASALIRLGRIDDAEQHAELARAKEPARAEELLARVALARGDEAAALEHARAAEAADPSLPLPLYVQGVALYNRRAFREALPYLEDAADELRRQQIELPDLHYYLADTLANLERYPEAEREFREELRLSPENGRARAKLGLLLYAQDRRDQAIDELAELVRLTPTPQAYRLAVDTMAIAGDLEQASRVLADGLRAFPDRELRALARR